MCSSRIDFGREMSIRIGFGTRAQPGERLPAIMLSFSRIIAEIYANAREGDRDLCECLEEKKEEAAVEVAATAAWRPRGWRGRILPQPRNKTR